MGVNTKGIMSSDVRVGDIVTVILNKFKIDVSVERTHADYYKVITFNYNGEDRRLSVFEDYDDVEHYDFISRDTITLIDFNLWGSAVEIISSIVEEFGGYVIESDCEAYEGDNLTFLSKRF